MTLSRTAAAQTGTAAAALNGTIRDASGAVVPGATVTLTNTKTWFQANNREQLHGELLHR